MEIRERPLGSLFQRKKRVGYLEETMLSVFRDHGVIRKDSRENLNRTAEDRGIYQLVEPGWLVVNRMKAWQGSVGIAFERGTVSGHYLCFRPVHGEDDRFLNHLLRSEPFRVQYASLSRGVRPGQAEIDNEWFKAIRVPLPPLDTQRHIADFLDDQVARLEATSQRAEDLLLLIDERVEALLAARIAPAFELGSPRLPIARLLRKLARPALGTVMVTAFRDGQVIARNLRRSAGFTNSWTEGATTQGVCVGDVVIHGLDGFAGAIGTSESDGVVSPANHVCLPLAGDSDFYGRLLRVLALGGYLSSYGGSARERAVDFRNWWKFSQIRLPVVPVPDQQEIGDLIRMSRPLRAEMQQLQRLVEERKRALITACVTGEFDVSTASSRASDAALAGVPNSP